MDRREIVWIVLFLIAGALGLMAFLRYYDEAFPIASLDFKLSREEAAEKAQEFLESAGYDIEGYQSAQIFAQDYGEQVFLERTLGLEEANRLAREWVSVWAWSIRWFKSLQKEELQVNLDPGGRVVAFVHRVLETSEGANLAEEEALPIAEAFLTDVQGFSLDDYDLIERSSVERKARTDHTFTYRKKGFVVGDDGHYRLRAIVKGDQVGYFAEYVKVPETFTRDYKEIRSRANLLGQVFSIFWLVLAVGMVVVLIVKYRDRALRWRTGLLVGGVVAVASLVGALNSLPLTRFGYPTTQAYDAFLVDKLIGGVMGSLLIGGIICIVATAGVALTRDLLFSGRSLAVGRLSVRTLFSATTAQSTLVGYGLAFTHLGYVTLFYILGTRYLGVWSPAQMADYDNAFSTAMPWIYPLLTGLLASTMEEFFFRLLAISLLLKYLRRPWIAVLLPAIVWGFLHSNYPVEPIYTRGLELTIVGVVFGIVYLRYGIWATVISHYAYNAFLSAFPMMQSSSTYFQVSGVAVVAILFLPAIPALYGLVTRKEGEADPEEDEGEVPADEPVTEMPPTDGEVVRKTPDAYLLDRTRFRVAVVLALIGAAAYMGFRVERFGSRTLVLATSRAEAVQIAVGFLTDIGVDIEGYRRTVRFRSNLGSSHYIHLVRNVGVARADTLASENSGPWMWSVRWYVPLQKEEVQVGVNERGRIVMFEHKLAEAETGARLEADSARTLAEAFVLEHWERDVTDETLYKVLEVKTEERENRTDHNFIWERIDCKVEDAEFRLYARVQGDRVGHAHGGYRAPEPFLRKLHEKKLKDVLARTLPVLAVLATFILAVCFFFQDFRQGRLSWSLPFRIGLFILVLTAIEKVNALPSFYRSYDTSQALSTFTITSMLGVVLGGVLFGLMAAVVVSLAMSLLHRLYPAEMPLRTWLGCARLQDGTAQLWGHSLLLGATLFLVRSGVGNLSFFVNYSWMEEYLKAGSYSPPGLNTYLPFLNGLTVYGTMVVVMFAVIAVVLIWLRILRRRLPLACLVIALAILLRSVEAAESATHFVGLVGLALISVGASLFV
ncbi:MAG: CPBP family intramembrane metalloprotease, partial [Candidatus Latescibacteria bacterium]|nr:CPBP family intramembrane metalloprotease [Candidatus Latescibacterota bacterium]